MVDVPAVGTGGADPVDADRVESAGGALMNIADVSLMKPRVVLGSTRALDCRLPAPVDLGPFEVHCISFADSDGHEHRAPIGFIEDMIAGQQPDSTQYADPHAGLRELGQDVTSPFKPERVRQPCPHGVDHTPMRLRRRRPRYRVVLADRLEGRRSRSRSGV